MLAKNTRVLQLIPTGYLNLTLLNLIRNYSKEIIKNSNKQVISKAKHIFLNRLESEGRNLKNECNTLKLIKNFYPDIHVIYPGKLSFFQQINEVSNAELIISIHGAQSTNIIWANQLKIYIEISSFTNEFSFINLATLFNAKSFQVSSMPINSNDLWSPHICNLNELEKKLELIHSSS